MLDFFDKELESIQSEVYEKRIVHLLHNKRVVIYSHVLLTFFTQSILVVLSFYELCTNRQWYIFFAVPVYAPIMFGRFICTAILHLSMLDGITLGFQLMKFALNHPYKFEHSALAWLSGLMFVLS